MYILDGSNNKGNCVVCPIGVYLKKYLTMGWVFYPDNNYLRHATRVLYIRPWKFFV